jgi:hypothetical protein
MALDDLVAFCTLADLKSELGITDSASDGALERRILVASAMIENYCQRTFRRNTAKVEQLAGFGTVYLFPTLTPVDSITSITLWGDLVDSSLYEIHDGSLIYSSNGWIDTSLVAQTMTSDLQRIPGTAERAFEVTYDGGYYLPNDDAQAGTPLPVDITEACLAMAATLHRNAGRDQSVQAESVGDASVQFAGGVAGREAMPLYVKSLLAPYKRAV